MDKETSKKLTPGIDEELMMNLMADGIKKEGIKMPEEGTERSEASLKDKAYQKDKVKNSRRREEDYEKLFFRRPETNARDGKTVYIRQDFHEKLSRIVQVIGEDKISIYAYLDNILEYHFQEFGEQITTSFNNKYKPIL